MLHPLSKGMYFELLRQRQFMKNIKQQTPNHNTKLNNNRHRPENKDNLDSREGEEQLLKGDDTTHNTKERKNPKKGKRK
jgi:hypothetical protein